MIICAAIKIEHTDNVGNPLDSLIVCGHRHGDCYNTIKYLDINRVSVIEGFIDNKGDFYSRERAFIHADICGQINKHNQWYRDDNKIPRELYSEDLY